MVELTTLIFFVVTMQVKSQPYMIRLMLLLLDIVMYHYLPSRMEQSTNLVEEVQRW